MAYSTSKYLSMGDGPGLLKQPLEAQYQHELYRSLYKCLVNRYISHWSSPGLRAVGGPIFEYELISMKCGTQNVSERAEN